LHHREIGEHHYKRQDILNGVGGIGLYPWVAKTLNEGMHNPDFLKSKVYVFNFNVSAWAHNM
jgi:hypothetical protein